MFSLQGNDGNTDDGNCVLSHIQIVLLFFCGFVVVLRRNFAHYVFFLSFLAVAPCEFYAVSNRYSLGQMRQLTWVFGAVKFTLFHVIVNLLD